MCRCSRVADSMRDVPMSEVVLDKSGVAAFVCQIIAGRMPQHMRIDLEIHFCANAGLFDQIVDRLAGHRTAFAQEQII